MVPAPVFMIGVIIFFLAFAVSPPGWGKEPDIWVSSNQQTESTSELLPSSEELPASELLPSSEELPVSKSLSASEELPASSLPADGQTGPQEAIQLPPVPPDFELLGVVTEDEKGTIPCPEDSFLVFLKLKSNISFHSSALMKFQTGQVNELSMIKPEEGNLVPPCSLAFRLNHLSGQELALLRDSNDGHWDGTTLFDATLVAEGLISPEARNPYEEKMTRFRSDLQRLTKNIRDPIQRVRTVYEYMHRRILTNQYDLNKSGVAYALDTGVFNCVSATILFNCLAGEIGLTVTGLETTGHAKSRVLFERHYLDIETTCTQWQLLPDRLRLRTTEYSVARPMTPSAPQPAENGDSPVESIPLPASSQPVTESIPLPKPAGTLNNGKSLSEKGEMREINSVQLAATVYYNRGVDYSQSSQYANALCAYIKANHLDPDNPTILGNLKATMNNWAIDLATVTRNFPESIRITECGLALDPDFDQLGTNLPIFYQHWISELKKELRFEEAEYLEDLFQKRFL